MNVSILIDSLEYLTYRFALVTKLSIWIHETLKIIHYDHTKVQKAIENHDISIIKYLLERITDHSFLECYIDDWLNIVNDDPEIIILIYDDTSLYSYKKIEVYEHSCKLSIKKIILHFVDEMDDNIITHLLTVAINYSSDDIIKILLPRIKEQSIIDNSFEKVMSQLRTTLNYREIIKIFLDYNVEPNVVIDNIIDHNIYCVFDILSDYIFSKNKMFEFLVAGLKNYKYQLVVLILNSYHNIDICRTDFEPLNINESANKISIAELLLRYNYKTTLIDFKSEPKLLEIYEKHQRINS